MAFQTMLHTRIEEEIPCFSRSFLLSATLALGLEMTIVLGLGGPGSFFTKG